MSAGKADALVFYGATGDLAYKKIFPALQGMICRGALDVPVVAVAKESWSLEQLQARAKESLTKHGGVDYAEPATFHAIKRALGDARRPVHYLAIPQGLFGLVTEQLARAGCAEGARLVIEKPFGNDLATARALNATLHRSFAERDLF